MLLLLLLPLRLRLPPPPLRRRKLPERKPPTASANAPNKNKEERLQGILQHRNINIKVGGGARRCLYVGCFTYVPIMCTPRGVAHVCVEGQAPLHHCSACCAHPLTHPATHNLNHIFNYGHLHLLLCPYTRTHAALSKALPCPPLPPPQ